ncbi:hypothetical protein [Streptomyces parvus]|uniref:hypothetical protein n=1 Tax=Streptomyces parvus TaxID=66428 RepID=UPI0035DE178E
MTENKLPTYEGFVPDAEIGHLLRGRAAFVSVPDEDEQHLLTDELAARIIGWAESDQGIRHHVAESQSISYSSAGGTTRVTFTERTINDVKLYQVTHISGGLDVLGARATTYLRAIFTGRDAAVGYYQDLTHDRLPTVDLARTPVVGA